VQYIGKIETWFSGNLLAELPKILKWKFPEDKPVISKTSSVCSRNNLFIQKKSMFIEF
jgi:hypothetical protein